MIFMLVASFTKAASGFQPCKTNMEPSHMEPWSWAHSAVPVPWELPLWLRCLMAFSQALTAALVVTTSRRRRQVGRSSSSCTARRQRLDFSEADSTAFNVTMLGENVDEEDEVEEEVEGVEEE